MLDVLRAKPVIEGKSVKIKQILPSRKCRNLNPFLRIDHFNIDQGGFPNQLHHGFEGIFYLFSGEIHHEDSMANFFDIKPGGAELFTAGAGLIHAELVENKAHGIRVWIDLPEDKKYMKPSYQRFEALDFPEVTSKGVCVRTVVGEGSPLKPQTNVEMLDVTLCSKSVFKYIIPENFNGFLYVVVGSIKIKGKVIQASEMICMKSGDDIVMLSNTGARVLLCFGEPHEGKLSHAQSYDTI